MLPLIQKAFHRRYRFGFITITQNGELCVCVVRLLFTYSAFQRTLGNYHST